MNSRRVRERCQLTESLSSELMFPAAVPPHIAESLRLCGQEIQSKNRRGSASPECFFLKFNAAARPQYALALQISQQFPVQLRIQLLEHLALRQRRFSIANLQVG